MEQKCVRIIITGKTGVGKSSLANSLFSERVFKASCKLSSVTKKSQSHSKKVKDNILTAIDAPGFYDTNDDVDIDSEMTKCIKLSLPGPHVIVNVVNIGRLTKEDEMSLTSFIDKFGNGIEKYCILVLTRFDDYKREYGTSDFDFEDFLKDLPLQFQSLLKDTFQNRYFPFDNTLSGSSANEQVSRFMQKVNDVIATNGGKNYTNEDFRKADIADKQKKEEQNQKEMRQKEEEIERIRREEHAKNQKQYQEELKKERERMDQQREMYDKNMHDMQKEIEHVKKETQKKIESLKENDSSLSFMSVLSTVGDISRFCNTVCEMGQSVGNIVNKGKTTVENVTRNSDPETTVSLQTNSKPVTMEYSSVLGYPEIKFNKPKPNNIDAMLFKIQLDQYLQGEKTEQFDLNE